MKIDLEKEDLVNLVMGITPFYNEFEHPLVKENGSYVGGFVDEWRWAKYKLIELNEDELYELYLICKNSWKEA